MLWDRKIDNGFPETKILKQRLRNHIDPEKNLGHSDTASSRIQKLDPTVVTDTKLESNDANQDCKDCAWFYLLVLVVHSINTSSILGSSLNNAFEVIVHKPISPFGSEPSQWYIYFKGSLLESHHQWRRNAFVDLVVARIWSNGPIQRHKTIEFMLDCWL